MSFVSDIRDICGDYALDIKYTENSADVITLFFNSRRNAETVKRVIEADDSVPNVATAVDFVEVVRCKDCKYRNSEACPLAYWDNGDIICDTQDNDFCSGGERHDREFKPCPFCGGKARAVVDDETETKLLIQCEKCKAQTGEFEYLEDAERAWERRAENGK